MDSINSFIHLLDKIETQDRRLGMTIKNLRWSWRMPWR